MREIVLDTETTGFDHRGLDRIVEIGCVELINHMPSGRTYHQYINPERDMPDGAYQVHGLSEAFLAEYPVFADIADAFAAFIGDATLVIHNAEFDMGFINAEFKRLKRPALPMERAVDTVAMARRRYPGAQASLDALCTRFGIDNSSRTKHGALLDAELLAEVYLELLGGKQIGLGLAGSSSAENDLAGATGTPTIERVFRPARPHHFSEAEQAAHLKLLERIDNPIWDRS